MNLSLTTKIEELEGRLPPQDEECDNDYVLSRNDLLEFQTILITYLDFKQKEKFSKLKKLRETQENLPVSNYRYIFKNINRLQRRKNVLIIYKNEACGV